MLEANSLKHIFLFVSPLWEMNIKKRDFPVLWQPCVIQPFSIYLPMALLEPPFPVATLAATLPLFVS